MQAVESETLILYHTDLRGQWPRAAARALAARLRYAKRLAVLTDSERAHASLAGIALALRALSALTGRRVAAGELLFASGEKPQLAGAAVADFSISHSGHLVGCAAVRAGRVGFDVELGGGARIARWVRHEAALKACGAGLAARHEVRLAVGGARCRGVRWYAQSPAVFEDAAACVMTDRAHGSLATRAVALAELFGP
jgi:hypothetical protein